VGCWSWSHRGRCFAAQAMLGPARPAGFRGWQPAFEEPVTSRLALAQHYSAAQGPYHPPLTLIPPEAGRFRRFELFAQGREESPGRLVPWAAVGMAGAPEAAARAGLTVETGPMEFEGPAMALNHAGGFLG